MGHSNLFNFALVVLVAVPSIVFYAFFLHRCDGTGSGGEENAASWGSVCEWGREHPWYLVNALFFLNVDVLFWIIGILQSSVWLIDPYWSILPVLILHFFDLHPSSQTDLFRSRAVIGLIWLWSFRMTYSYLRREEWNWGEREDWRFANFRKQHGKHWFWTSFFLVFVSQHIFLVGLTLPIYTVYQSRLPWNAWDILACVLCVAGIWIAHFADTQLYYFCYKNKVLKEIGGPKVLLLDSGLWKYSRHPNYFGEQLFWWGLSLFAWNVGQGWAVVGSAINSACLAQVTVMVEQRMVQDESRADVYREYQKSTSVLIPWFKRSATKPGEGKSKSS